MFNNLIKAATQFIDTQLSYCLEYEEHVEYSQTHYFEPVTVAQVVPNDVQLTTDNNQKLLVADVDVRNHYHQSERDKAINWRYQFESAHTYWMTDEAIPYPYEDDEELYPYYTYSSSLQEEPKSPNLFISLDKLGEKVEKFLPKAHEIISRLAPVVLPYVFVFVIWTIS